MIDACESNDWIQHVRPHPQEGFVDNVDDELSAGQDWTVHKMGEFDKMGIYGSTSSSLWSKLLHS